MPVVLTETAAREIATIVKQQELDPEKIRLRVGVKGGGCSGFSYLLDLTETQKEMDEEWDFTFEVAETAEGEAANEESGGVATKPFTIKVICDPKSYLYLNGTTIDFKDELMGRGFVFNNPNASSTCGCGSSFSA
ncbi:MAG: iron-sulfur cluster assembly accessory protein [Phycisphaerales bacterium]|nr:iron-sulfur cluster assembly accessory protein [Phycisphaerae bacterium]NNF43747.1 iron-sulfur cluster assembly accessory protein [Phycisphaerales bacterium]NNM26404.1 iron-sulfur cluster assembly accessory protein [Phycisphaerales bacterium]